MVDDELDELRREFLNEAREKAAEMKAAAGQDDLLPALERIAYLAHQLKGSGGSYGFPSISNGAAGLERTVETAAGTAARGSAETIRVQVEQLVEEIDRCAAKLGNRTSPSP